ncbi:MAG: hypothetical protein IPJ90_05040 [Anaerolineaceae bacterium]|nr:hypothetical protein [Anaerolineaceae bacterium]
MIQISRQRHTVGHGNAYVRLSAYVILGWRQLEQLGDKPPPIEVNSPARGGKRGQPQPFF